MDDRDLQLLRGFRVAEAEPPAGMQERIEERLWQSILAEEGAHAPRRRGRRPWYQELLRPAAAVGAAATMAIGVAVLGGDGTGTGISSTVTRAGVLDTTAATIFGESGATGSTGAPIAGAIDLTDPDDADETLLRGPVTTPEGRLDEATLEVVRETTREPGDLQSRMLRGATDLAGPEQAEWAAYHATMRWVVEPQVPSDLRAAMLRSLEGLGGIDAAISGADLLDRSGIVLGYLDPRTGLRAQHLLDVDGGRLLERRTLTTQYVDPACPPGTFTSHELLDEQGTPIRQADAPWLDWPLVVEACDPRLVSG